MQVMIFSFAAFFFYLFWKNALVELPKEHYVSVLSSDFGAIEDSEFTDKPKLCIRFDAEMHFSICHEYIFSISVLIFPMGLSRTQHFGRQAIFAIFLKNIFLL